MNMNVIILYVKIAQINGNITVIDVVQLNYFVKNAFWVLIVHVGYVKKNMNGIMCVQIVQ